MKDIDDGGNNTTEAGNGRHSGYQQPADKAGPAACLEDIDQRIEQIGKRERSDHRQQDPLEGGEYDSKATTTTPKVHIFASR